MLYSKKTDDCISQCQRCRHQINVVKLLPGTTRHDTDFSIGGTTLPQSVYIMIIKSNAKNNPKLPFTVPQWARHMHSALA